MFSEISEIKKYINVSANLDIRLLEPYQEEALRKIYEYIPAEILTKIEAEHTHAYELLRKAVANYTIVYALPFLKIHLSNTGGNNFQDGKMNKAEWYDLRDFGISASRIADKALSDALTYLRKTDLANNITAFADEDVIFKTPTDFECVYPIGNSWGVFLKLKPTIRHVWRVFLQERLKDCTAQTLLADARTAQLLKDMIGYYTIAETVGEPQLLYTTSGIVIQWEQLPWQQSKVLDTKQINEIRERNTQRANYLFYLLLKIIQDNPTDFPCYAQRSPIPVRTPQIRKSGLYL